jgi:plasmid stabilization system protein ParE
LASVVVSVTAERNLRSLIETHSLPTSTDKRLRASLEPLREFPLLGSPLGGRWAGFRFILGPWRWIIVDYWYNKDLDRVEVLTIRDARSARSPTTSR